MGASGSACGRAGTLYNVWERLGPSSKVSERMEAPGNVREPSPTFGHAWGSQGNAWERLGALGSYWELERLGSSGLVLECVGALVERCERLGALWIA